MIDLNPPEGLTKDGSDLPGDQYLELRREVQLIKKPSDCEVVKYQPPQPFIVLPDYDPENKTRRFIRLTETGLVVTYNQELDYYHYLKGKDSSVNFDMYLSAEARKLMTQLGWKRIRDLFQIDIEYINNKPFGARSLDPTRELNEAQIRRSINKVSDELQKVIGIPIAIKGTGKIVNPVYEWEFNRVREDLIGQYLRMRQLQVEARTVLTDEQKRIIELLPVYGVIKYPIETKEKYQEWLIMKKVVDGKMVKDVPYVMAMPGARPEDSIKYGFDDDKYSELAGALGLRRHPLWSDALRSLRSQGLSISDLAGRNILEQMTPSGGKRYTIIDQK